MEEYIRYRKERELLKQEETEIEQMREMKRRKAATKEVAQFRERVG